MWKAPDKTIYLIPTTWPPGPTGKFVGLNPPLSTKVSKTWDMNLNEGLSPCLVLIHLRSDAFQLWTIQNPAADKGL